MKDVTQGNRENLVILKFGGTSIRDHEGFEKAFRHVKKALYGENKVICVVSAMGRAGDAYATDTLRQLIRRYVTKREQDRLISVGETISSVVFADFLIHKGLRAISLATHEIGIITDHAFTDANIIAFHDTHIRHYLTAYDVLVVPGFQGLTEYGDVTTLGRGGSDTTAIVLGVHLNAKEIRIISDVDGIYSGDPRIIKNAYRYTYINYMQLQTITHNGSRVLHDKAAKIAAIHQAPIVFTHIDHDDRMTRVITEQVPLFNITAKHNFYRFHLNEPLHHPLADEYLGDYYVPVTESDELVKWLEEQNIGYEKTLGYSKINLFVDRDETKIKSVYVRNEELIEHMNFIHDLYLYRG